MKQVFVAALILALPVATFAAGEEPSKAPAQASVQHASTGSEISIVGGTSKNRSQIEKIAKEAGADKASFQTKTGMLKASGKNFNEEKFTSLLASKLPGVSVKK